MGAGRTLVDWVEYVVEAGRRPVTGFPPRDLLEELSRTFDGTVSWNWADADGEVGWRVLRPPPGWPPPGAVEYWLAHQQEHPLLGWYARTGSVTPMTMGRVPAWVAGRRDIEAAQERLGSSEMSQELAIPLRIAATSHQGFVISRGGGDFTDAELDLAGKLQPLLMLLAAQTRTAERRGALAGDRFDLTAREVEVLHCLESGLTMVAMARRLSCSPRTVEKHLEHIYRKMGVRNRLDAIRALDLPPCARHVACHGQDRGAAPERPLLVFEGRIRPPTARTRLEPGPLLLRAPPAPRRAADGR